MDSKEEKGLQKAKGLKRIIFAIGYSFSGITSACRHEQAFMQELIVCFILIPLAVVLPFSLVEMAILIFCLVFVLVVELLNSAIEWVVDYISLEKHPFAKLAKDMASAAVFISILNALFIWGLFIFSKREILMNYFSF